MILPTVQYPDAYSMLISWTYWDEIGEGGAVSVSAWPRFCWQFTGDNAGNCELDIYGTNEGLQATCWGLLTTLMMPIRDRLHDPFVNGHELPIPGAVKPIIRGTSVPGNNLAVNLFCTKLFA